MPDNEESFALNVTLKSGETVKVEVSGYSDMRQAIGVLAQIGQPEYLMGIWQQFNDPEGWEAEYEDEDEQGPSAAVNPLLVNRGGLHG